MTSDGTKTKVIFEPVAIPMEPVDVKEACRTDALVSTLRRYVDKNSIPVKVKTAHLEDGKGFSEYSGGGVVQLCGKNGSLVFIQQEDEANGWEFVASASIEDKIQQVRIERILKQLQASMLLCMTMTWHNSLGSCNSSDIDKYASTIKIVCYGLAIALGKPIVMYQADMILRLVLPNFCD